MRTDFITTADLSINRRCRELADTIERIREYRKIGKSCPRGSLGRKRYAAKIRREKRLARQLRRALMIAVDNYSPECQDITYRATFAADQPKPIPAEQFQDGTDCPREAELCWLVYYSPTPLYVPINDPNKSHVDRRIARKVRHSVVGGHWRYTTIRVYPTALPDFAADKLLGESSRDIPLRGKRRKTINSKGKRVNLPREAIAPLPAELPMRETLGAAERELLALARQFEPEIMAGIEAGESQAAIAARLGISQQAVSKRIAAVRDRFGDTKDGLFDNSWAI